MLPLLQKPFSFQDILMLAALSSGGLLATALIAQYGFHLAPCHLCLLQRYPYLAIILLGLAGSYLPVSARIRMLLAYGCAALFTLDAGIAFYHSGVELGWFKAPDSCSSNSSVGESLEAMRAAIMNAPLVTCDQAMAHVFGLSLAAWNALAAASLAVATLILCRRARMPS